MPNSYFSFKQFSVYHHRCAMKVGIDGVLLGAWAPVKNTANILDIGTGCGLIALMLAQRTNATITAIDIEPNAIIQANENIVNSPWKERILAEEISLQEFARRESVTFDLIVSNPPYFVNSLKTPDENRTTARHADSLTHKELMVNAKKLLASKGKVCLILPVNEGLQCVELGKTIDLHCHRMIYVHPKPNAEAKRLLLEFGLAPVDVKVSRLEIETAQRHQYSEEFTALAKDYYLKL